MTATSEGSGARAAARGVQGERRIAIAEPVVEPPIIRTVASAGPPQHRAIDHAAGLELTQRWALVARSEDDPCARVGQGVVELVGREHAAEGDQHGSGLRDPVVGDDPLHAVGRRTGRRDPPVSRPRRPSRSRPDSRGRRALGTKGVDRRRRALCGARDGPRRWRGLRQASRSSIAQPPGGDSGAPTSVGHSRTEPAGAPNGARLAVRRATRHPSSPVGLASIVTRAERS